MNALRSVPPLHPLEHRVGSGLHREVDLRADLRLVRHRLDDPVGEVDGVGAGEADALDPVDLGHGAQQGGEVNVVPDVGVDGLSEEHDLLVPGRGERPDVPQDLARRDASLAPPGVGHHAESAELVAAALDRDVAGVVGRLVRIQPLVDLFAVELDVDRGLAGPGAVDQRRDRAVAVGAGDDGDVRGALGHLFLEVLGHTAGDADDELGVVGPVAQQLAGAAPHAILRLLPDRAGVDQDDVRLGRIADVTVACALQLSRDQGRVGLVHLTAERLEIDAGAVRHRLRWWGAADLHQRRHRTRSHCLRDKGAGCQCGTSASSAPRDAKIGGRGLLRLVSCA